MPGGLPLHRILLHVWRHLGDVDPDSVAVGAVTLAAGIAFKHYWPRFPYMIAALIAGSLFAALIEFFTYAGFLHAGAGRPGPRRRPARGTGVSPHAGRGRQQPRSASC